MHLQDYLTTFEVWGPEKCYNVSKHLEKKDDDAAKPPSKIEIPGIIA